MSQTENRSILLKRNVIASLFIKGWSVIVQILLVPMTLSCLGVYENGVWLTISSLLLWIDNLDIGIGNGLRNKLAAAIAHDDHVEARKVVSSTLAMLIAIIIPILAILLVIETTTDNYALLNVNRVYIENLDVVIAVSTILVCGTFVLKFIGNFYMGLQLPAISNLLVTSGNTLTLLGTFLIYISGSHSFLLVAIANTAAPLVVYLCCYPITFRLKYKYLRPSLHYISYEAAKSLFSIGCRFFILQISGVLLFFSSNLIISRIFSPSMVTPFQIASRYFMVIMLLFTIVCVPYWNATTDAYERKDFDWIKRSGKTLDRFLLLVFLLIILMIVVSPFVYNIWIGKQATIPFTMTIMVGIYEFVLVSSTRYSFILNGIGLLTLQLRMTILAAIVYIPLALFVSKQSMNINWLLAIMCIVNLPGLIVNYIQYHKIIKGTAHGIWKK